MAAPKNPNGGRPASWEDDVRRKGHRCAIVFLEHGETGARFAFWVAGGNVGGRCRAVHVDEVGGDVLDLPSGVLRQLTDAEALRARSCPPEATRAAREAARRAYQREAAGW